MSAFLSRAGNHRFVRSVAAVCCGVLLSIVGVHAQDSNDKSNPHYESKFDEGNTDGWSHKNIVSVGGRKLAWLGEFNKEKVTLTANKLPKHKFVKLEFDLAILKSWGGHAGGHHADVPDLLTLSVVGGPQLMHASFGNGSAHRQSFPDDFQFGDRPARHGATQTDNADFLRLDNGNDGGNAVYRIAFIFPHDKDDLQIVLQASLKEALPANLSIRNESWAIGSVRVSAMAEPTKLSDDEFKKLWAQLAKPEGMDGFNAMWRLVGGGEATVAQIAKQWKAETTPANEKALRARFDEVLANLGSEKFATREKAQEELMAMDPKVLPWIREALAKHKDDAELSSRLERSVAAFEKRSVAKTVDYRAIRLHRLLSVVGTKHAKKLQATIPAPTKVKPKAPPVRPVPRPFPGRFPDFIPRP